MIAWLLVGSLVAFWAVAVALLAWLTFDFFRRERGVVRWLGSAFYASVCGLVLFGGLTLWAAIFTAPK